MLNFVCAQFFRKNVKIFSLRSHDFERCDGIALFVRTLSLSKCKKKDVIPNNVQRQDWNKAVSEAEKVVGYPTSFLSLRWLLSDEIANVALHLRKLVGSNHPLLKTAKYLVHNRESAIHKWGLIILLISKAAGHSSLIPDSEQEKNTGILHSQRALAEITEMIRISHLIHTSLANLQPSIRAGRDSSFISNMIFGNKIGLLSGDYILAHSFVELSNLRNQGLQELIASAIRDFTESEFIGDRDEQNNPLPSKPQPNRIPPYEIDEDYIETDLIIPMDVERCMGIPYKEWALRHILSAGSLLGKSCQGSLKLALKPEEMQQKGYLFGKHLSLAWQACLDLEPFRDGTLPVDKKFSLVSAPVLFHLNHDPSIYVEIEKGKTSIENVDFTKLFNEILLGPGLKKTRMLQDKHTKAAMRVLEGFPPSEGRTALNNILLVMQNL